MSWMRTSSSRMMMFQGIAFAAEKTQAVASPKCDMEKVKKIGGKAVVKIEKGAWDGGYNITLNTDKLTFSELLQKMVKEKCM